MARNDANGTFGRGVNPLRQRVLKPGKVARRDERREIVLEIPIFLLTRFEICVRNGIDRKYRQERVPRRISQICAVWLAQLSGLVTQHGMVSRLRADVIQQ
jgi:hypothetical protein